MSTVIVGNHHPVARLVHDCDYCGQDIPAGQRYRRWTCIQDREARTVKAHIACNAVAMAYWQDIGADPDERWVGFEPLSEWARWNENPAAKLWALSLGWADGEYDRLAALLGCES